MKKQAYLIETGKYYTDGYPIAVCTTKKKAKELARKDGYEYDSFQKLFLNDKAGRYIRIETIDIDPEQL